MESELNGAPQEPQPKEPIAPPVNLRPVGDTLILHPIIDGEGERDGENLYVPASSLAFWESLKDGGSRIVVNDVANSVFIRVNESPDMIAQMRSAAIEWKESRGAAAAFQAQMQLAQRRSGLALPG
ncbi:MAG: hypothetical protein H0T51_02295 [Pirellulales bacterium]|nr:hypothetical protein [Pirellulales bacterium]